MKLGHCSPFEWVKRSDTCEQVVATNPGIRMFGVCIVLVMVSTKLHTDMTFIHSIMFTSSVADEPVVLENQIQ